MLGQRICSTLVAVGLVTLAGLSMSPGASAAAAAHAADDSLRVASACHELYLVSARGSGEAFTGSSSLAESPETAAVINALTKAMSAAGSHPDVVIHQLSYPAPSTSLLGSGLSLKLSLDANYQRLFHHNLPSYLLQEREGETELESYLGGIRSACGRTSEHPKVVLVGYSQGALVIHNVLRDLATKAGAAGLAQIADSVLVADPERMPSSAPVNFGSEHGSNSYGVCEAPRHLHITVHCYHAGNDAEIPAKAVGSTAQVCDVGDVVCDTSVLIKIQRISTYIAKFKQGEKIHTNCHSYCAGDVTTAGRWVARRLLNVGVGLAPLRISTASLPDGTEGSSYLASLVAAGGSGPYSWSAGAGTLPAGLILTADGQLSGTPTVAGPQELTIRVADSVGETATRTLSLYIADASPLQVIRRSGPAGFASSVTGYQCPAPADGTTMWIVPQGAGQPGPDYDQAIQLPIPTYLPQAIGVYTTTDAAIGSYTATLTCVQAANGSTVASGTPSGTLPFTQTVDADASHITVTSANDPNVPNRYTISSDGGCGSDPTGNQGINVVVSDATGSSNAFAFTPGPTTDVNGNWTAFQLNFPVGPKVAWSVQVSCAGNVSNDQSGYYYPTATVPVP